MKYCINKARVASSAAVIAVFTLLCQASGSQAGDSTTYADVAPVLVSRCVMCHAGDAAASGLRLDSYDAILRGSARGAVVRAGDPGASELVRRLKGLSQPRMPMTGPPFLSGSEVALFERWIAAGVPLGELPATDAAVATERPAPGQAVSYAQVAPILATRCAKCHSDGGLMGSAPEGYRLTSYADTLVVNERARVVPGNPDTSELVRRLRGQARPRMPFDGPPYLNAEEIRLIEDWVGQGARDAQGKVASIPRGSAVRLHGTLGAGWRLDGLELIVGPRTRIDKALAPGDYVEVRGRLDEQGRVHVERLRRR